MRQGKRGKFVLPKLPKAAGKFRVDYRGDVDSLVVKIEALARLKGIFFGASRAFGLGAHRWREKLDEVSFHH